MGKHSGAVSSQITACAPPNENRVSSSEDCAPWKFKSSVLLECNSRPETPKILDVTPEIVSKNGFFVDFEIKTVCFEDFTSEFMKIHQCLGTKIFVFVCILVFITKFVEICPSFEMKSRICENSRLFWHEDLFFGLRLRIRGNSRETPSSFSPHSRIQIHKLFVFPPQNLFVPPPPPSHAILSPGLVST